MAEFTSIEWALVVNGRGENLPYFGKQDNFMPHSPREQKRKPIQGLPEVSDMAKKGKRAQFGLISPQVLHPGRHGFTRLFWFTVTTGFLSMIGVVELFQKDQE
jgi:hypothetical protein